MRFREQHINLEGILVRCIWRISVQHPPTKLLDYIRSHEIGCESRAWATSRAVELGVPKADIREAILRHAEEVDTQLERASLVTLKQDAMEAGVLSSGDLPEVKLPRRGVGPTPEPSPWQQRSP